MFHSRFTILGVALVAACSGSVPADNPFDPAAPPEQQADGRYSGRVLLEGTGDHSGSVVRFLETDQEPPVSVEATTNASGDFALELAPGTYDVTASHAGYQRLAVGSVTLGPGERRSLGDLRLRVARGSLFGLVTTDDGSSPAGAVVSIVPLSPVGGGTPGALTESEAQGVAVVVGNDGAYSADELPEGDYDVRADRDGFAPSYSDAVTTVTGDSASEAPELRLYPATAIVQAQVNGVINAPYTNTRQIQVLLLAFVEQLVEMRVSEDPDFTDATWDTTYRDFAAAISFTLADSDGPRTLYAQFRDDLGLESQVFSTSLVLDRGLPSVTRATLNGGAPFLVGSPAASLQLEGEDGLSGVGAYRVTTTSGFTNEPWLPVQAVGSTVALTLPQVFNGADVTHTVRVQLQDRAGNPSAVASDGIYYDATPPDLEVPAISIGAQYSSPSGAVRSLDIGLDFHVSPDRTGERLYMAVANASGLDASSFFIPYATPYLHTLTPGPDGLPRQVCAVFRDEAGLLSSEQCLGVVVDRQSPAGPVVRIEEGSITNGDGCSARLHALGVYEFQLVVDDPADLVTAPWVRFVPTEVDGSQIVWADFPTPLADGEHTLYARYRNASGNETAVVQDVIVRDTVAPEVLAARVGDGSGYVTSLTGQTEVRVTCGDDRSSEADLSLSLTGDLVLDYEGELAAVVPVQVTTTDDGPKTIDVLCTDAAGNDSAVEDLDFTLDVEAPQLTVFSLNGGAAAEPTNRLSITVTTAASDDYSGVDAIALAGQSVSCATAQYVYPANAAVGFTLSAGEGLRSVFLCARDVAGNVSTSAIASDNALSVDTEAPAPPAVQLGGGTGWTRVLTPVSIVISGGVASDSVSVSGDLSGGGSSAWASRPTSVSLTGSEGEKRVTAVIYDAAGNPSTPTTAFIRFDQTQPDAGTVLLAGGQSTVRSDSIVITIADTAPDTMAFWNQAGGGCGAPACSDPRFDSFAPTTVFALSPGTGEKTVCWRFCDAAQNPTAVASRTLTLDTYIARPRPVLAAISPQAHLALLQGSYELTISGAGVAYDTEAQVGDFLFPCLGADPDHDCGEAQGECDTSCSVSLPDEIMRNAGAYLVRLITPDPVSGGIGTSQDTEWFSVVAPVPRLTRLTPRGMIQPVDGEGVPVGQVQTVELWGEDLMDNAQVRLANAFGAITSFEPAGTGVHLTVELSTEGLAPSHLTDYALTVVNPSPGGGESSLAFGLNPAVYDCPAQGACRSNLRATRAPSVDGRGVQQTYRLLDPELQFVAWQGGEAAAVRDAAGALMFRMLFPATGGALPLPLGAATVTLEETRGVQPFVRLSSATRRGSATASFGASMPLALGDTALSVATCDLTGDGNLDVIAGDTAGDLVVFRGDGGIILVQAQSMPLGARPMALRCADLDGDGWLDVAIADDEGRVLIARGSSAGTLSVPDALHMLSGTLQGLELGDVDGDLLPDLLARGGGTTVAFRFGRGDGSFGPVSTLDVVPSAFTDLTLADLDGDGVEDLLALAHTQPSLHVWRGDGAGGFASAGSYNMGAQGVSLATADLNGDGALDVVTSHDQQGDIFVRLGLGDGSLGGATLYDLSVVGPAYLFTVEIMDMTGDGKLDLLIGDYANGVWVAAGNGDGTFIPPASWRLSSFGTITTAIAADLNNDGAPDVLATSALDERVEVQLNVGAATTGGARAWNMGSNPNQVRTGDVNLDGKVDLLSNDYSAVTHRLGAGDGTFANKSPWSMVGSLRAFELEDFNGDGLVDLASVDISTQLAVRLGSGDGSFAPEISIVIPSGSHGALASGDLDGDGKPDLVVTNESNGDISVMRGIGDGTFVPAGEYVTSADPASLRITDLDGDNRLDVLVGCRGGAAIDIFYGNGNGTLAASPLTVSMPGWVTSIGSGDLDGDGRQDVVALGALDLGWRLATGPRAFEATSRTREVLQDGGYYRQMKLVDLNGDGLLDVSYTSSANTLSLHFGDGAGDFGARLDLSGGTAPQALEVADIDANGSLDLITQSSSSHEARVLQRPPPAPFPQELRDMPAMSVALAPGTTELSVHQTAQYVQDVALRVRLSDPSASALGAISVELRAPRGESELVNDADGDTGCDPNWTGEPVWQASYPTTPTCAVMTQFDGWQPAGEWTLIVTNTSATTVELQDFAVLLLGSFTQPPRGTTPSAPDRLLVPSGAQSVRAHGTTLGSPDSAALSCQTTQGDKDGDGRNDVGERWYTVTLAQRDFLATRLFAEFDAVLDLRAGACPGTSLVCADGTVADLRAGMLVPAGQYCVVVDGRYDTRGTGGTSDDRVHGGAFDLAVSLPGAVDVTANINGARISGTTVGGIVDPVPGCVAVASAPDRFFYFTAPVTGTVTASTVHAGTTFDTVLAARAELALPNLACNDDFIGNASQITFAVTGGQTYLVMVTGYSNREGSFELSLTMP